MGVLGVMTLDSWEPGGDDGDDGDDGGDEDRRRFLFLFSSEELS